MTEDKLPQTAIPSSIDLEKGIENYSKILKQFILDSEALHENPNVSISESLKLEREKIVKELSDKVRDVKESLVSLNIYYEFVNGIFEKENRRKKRQKRTDILDKIELITGAEIGL